MRDFLKKWVLAPGMIRVACFLLSRVLRPRSTLARLHKQSSRLFVLANGPSLTTDIDRFRSELGGCDKLAVNHAIKDPSIVTLRPSIYLLADPAFFAPLSILSRELQKKMETLRNALLTSVTWAMTIVVPDTAMDSELVQAIKGKTNLTVVSFWRGVPVPEDISDFQGWCSNRYAPPGQNVVNTALYLGVFCGYKEIVLIGADTSFHTMLRIEQESNRVYVEDEHFYGKEKVYLYSDVARRVPQKLSEQFAGISRAFRWYDKLREFADWAGVKIVNASSFSWIDSFERPAFPSDRRMS